MLRSNARTAHRLVALAVSDESGIADAVNVPLIVQAWVGRVFAAVPHACALQPTKYSKRLAVPPRARRVVTPCRAVPCEQVKLGFEPLVFLVGAGWAPSPGADAPAGWDTDDFDLWPTPTQARSALGGPHGRACVTDRRVLSSAGRSRPSRAAASASHAELDRGASVRSAGASDGSHAVACAPARTRAIELSMEHAALVGTPGRAGQFSASSRCYWCAV